MEVIFKGVFANVRGESPNVYSNHDHEGGSAGERKCCSNFSLGVYDLYIYIYIYNRIHIYIYIHIYI